MPDYEAGLTKIRETLQQANCALDSANEAAEQTNAALKSSRKQIDHMLLRLKAEPETGFHLPVKRWL
jgi:F0F1-type ATP synthase membrane subunit b/b'